VAELSVEERLQPSLLDRLTDSEPESNVESQAQRVLSVGKLKRSVMRDLEWLLNTGSLATTEDLDDFPGVENSVLNYGISSLSGTTASAIDGPALERRIRRAILVFEPRILADSLKVRVNVDEEKMSLKRVTFTIEGQLWAQPLPVGLYLSTDLDLETGSVTVSETGR
jgi:type VI secretion system protein ImpF